MLSVGSGGSIFFGFLLICLSDIRVESQPFYGDLSGGNFQQNSQFPDDFGADAELRAQLTSLRLGRRNRDSLSDLSNGPDEGFPPFISGRGLPPGFFARKLFLSRFKNLKRFNRKDDDDNDDDDDDDIYSQDSSSLRGQFSVKDSFSAQYRQQSNDLLVEPISFSSNRDQILYSQASTGSTSRRIKADLYDQLISAGQPSSTDDSVPTGFATVTRGSRVSGGFRLLFGATERQCLDACLMTSRCLAVDYDSVERSCYAHSTSSYCSGLFTASNVNHYQRVPCIYGSVNRVAEVRYNYLVPGAEESCTDCSLDDCLDGCLDDSDCLGVDYDDSNQRCYTHTDDTVCGTFVPTSNVAHISLKECSGGGLNIFGPPWNYNSWFSRIRFMGPTKLPRGWLAYPGFRVSGGEVIAFNVSGDECAALCALHDSCHSFDYNTRDGSCWVEASERLKCGSLIPTNDVYHAKKPKPCR